MTWFMMSCEKANFRRFLGFVAFKIWDGVPMSLTEAKVYTHVLPM